MRPIRIVRIIARLNIGGPAIQAITLTRRLEQRGYLTRLLRGSESEREGNMDHLARDLGVKPTRVAGLRRDPGGADVWALFALARILRRDRPLIVHTHAAKAGALGRVAAMIAFPRRRPLLVHTFHGHSLSGYFSPSTTRAYRAIERWLARRTDSLVAVSDEVRDELVALGVAERESFTVVPLGLDLTGFVSDEDRAARRAAIRAEWGLEPEDEVVTLIARLVPIKRVDRFLRVAGLLAGRSRCRFVVVGGGALEDQLINSPEARALGSRLRWTGFRRDMPDVCFGSDVVVLTSDNEGTPVSLIEAQAAAVPVVGTDVGGVRSAVRHGETGLLAGAGDDAGLAAAIGAILDQPELAARLASAGRAHVTQTFALERLVDDIDRLYRDLLAARAGAAASPTSAAGS
ncbi:MAG TPA: glycosyltransferase [Solirubrobacteraceae bacterium]|nr:glycosyltransferase [Solirubrobacteraceae bacterium]